MNNLQIFNNEEFGDIRTVTINGDGWFVGKDVAEALGYSNSRKALADHVDSEDKTQGDGVTIRDAIGREQAATLINESGLYALVFGSKLDSAKKFKRWVTSEILPAIRKTGTYELEGLSKELKAVIVVDKRVTKIEDRLDKFENDTPLHAYEAEEISNHVKRKGVKVLGGKDSEAYRDLSIRRKIYSDIYGQMKREFISPEETKISYKAIKRKYLADVHEFIDCYNPPVSLKELIDDANAQERIAV